MSLGLAPGDIITSTFWSGWGYPGAKLITCGPYRIEQVKGPCTCARYNHNPDKLSHLPSEPHFHLVCTDIRPEVHRPGQRTGGSYLHGYVQRGDRWVSVWPGEDPYTGELNDRPLCELFLLERAIPPTGHQFTLF